MNREPLDKCAVKSGPFDIRIMYRFLLVALLLSLVAGCASSPASTSLSETREMAIGANKLGNKAFRRGDYGEALALYNEALRYNRSIEDRDGMALNMLNLAATSRRLEDYEAAHGHADAILNSPGIGFSALYLAEASYIKALTYTDQKILDNAANSLEGGMQLCRKAGCPMEGRFYNLLARLAVQRGELKEALDHSERGLVLSRRHGDSREVANALRLMADTKRGLLLYAGTERLYGEALAIDKELGLSRKIAADLRGMGHLSFGQDRFEDALRYFNRALSVSENAETDEEGVSLASEMLERCRERLKDR